MTIFGKYNGSKAALSPRVKHNGVIKQPTTGWVKRDGVLKCIYRRAAAVVQVLVASQIIEVPEPATAALISGCGAGSTNYAGASVINWYTPVTAGDAIECTVGVYGTSGTDTSFGNLITLHGGASGGIGAVNVCRNFSEGAETPFGKSHTSGYGAAGRSGILIIKWITESTGLVLTAPQTITTPANITGVLVSGCGGGGAFVRGGGIS